MKIIPNEVRLTVRSLKADYARGELDNASYRNAMMHLKAAEKEFPNHFGILDTSKPSPLMIGIANFGVGLHRTMVGVTEYVSGNRGNISGESNSLWEENEALKLERLPSWQWSLFHDVLDRARTEWAGRFIPRQKHVAQELSFSIEPTCAIDATRYANATPEGWGTIQVGKLSNINPKGPRLGANLLAVTYDDEGKERNFNIVALGCHADRPKDSIDFESESMSMSTSVTCNLHHMVYHAIQSLWAKQYLSEIHGAIEESFDVSWFREMQLAQYEATPDERLQSDAAIYLVAAVQFRKHLFIANIGKTRAFLWDVNKITPLTFSRLVGDRPRVGNPRKEVDNETKKLTVRLSKYPNRTEGTPKPDIACLPTEEVKGKLLLLATPDIIDSIDTFVLRNIIRRGDETGSIERIFREARKNGFVEDAQIALIPL